MRIPLVLALCTALLTPVLAPVLAETVPAPLPGAGGGFLPEVHFDEDLDAGMARAAMLRGEILPLDRILDLVRAAFPGEIIEIELEIEDGSLVYEFDILSPEGRLFEVEIEAATGKVLEIEEGDDDD